MYAYLKYLLVKDFFSQTPFSLFFTDHWPANKSERCAGCLRHWSNKEIIKRMPPHRIAGNEWDSFSPTRHIELPAVFVASFRRPIDRALSQFRFECIEDRGCSIKDPGLWWEKRRDLYNVYTWTFGNVNFVAQMSSGTENAEKRGNAVGTALDTISKFHLVLVMEWLAYAGPSITSILGFNNTAAVTKRVRPHIEQRKRDDHAETNQLGAAGVKQGSWTPKDYLTPAQYKSYSENLAMDSILTDVARRLFLERVVCDDLAA
jgi:hypothetical protein